MLDAQIAADPSLRAELGRLTLAADALPLGLEPAEPSPGLRNRLEAAIFADLTATAPQSAPVHPAYQVAWQGQATPRQEPPPATPQLVQLPVPTARRQYPINAWAIAAALLLVISVAAVGWGIQQSRLTGPPMRTVALDMADSAAGATGELAFIEQPPMMLLTVDNMPPLPPDQVYEVWLIPHDGDPIPHGVFTTTSTSHALGGSPADFQAVAVTMEPGPMGTMSPTTAPLVTATFGD
jgi:anti-sigma-K factor RskA